MSMKFTVVSLLLLVEGLPAGRRRLVPCVSNIDDQRCHFGLSATTERDRGFADSLLEGDGFEPSVPHTKQPFWVPRSVPQFAFRDKNRLFRARDRWFESISLQRGVSEAAEESYHHSVG